jgi:hypothetical protein
MSQEQNGGTFLKNLTSQSVASMMLLSSARRRHGLTRDVLRTSVSGAINPPLRAGRGATARARRGLLAERLLTRPVLVQAPFLGR